VCDTASCAVEPAAPGEGAAHNCASPDGSVPAVGQLYSGKPGSLGPWLSGLVDTGPDAAVGSGVQCAAVGSPFARFLRSHPPGVR